MQEAKWYFMDSHGQRQGPVADADLIVAYRRGDLLRDGLVWREGMPQWLPMAQVENELGIDPSDHGAAPPPLPESPHHHVMAAAPRSGGIGRIEIVYAGFWRRYAALFLDSLILAIPAFVVAFVLAFPAGMLMKDSDESTQLIVGQCIGFAVSLIMHALYFAGMESSVRQATLGKRAVGIKVTDNNGQRLSFSKALDRWFAATLSYLTCYIGFAMAGFTDRKRALHDMLAGTLVVDQWAYSEFPERQQRGLSGCVIVFIIGVALVIPITAILAAIAIPAYQDYVIRSQVFEGSSLADGSKTAVAEFYSNTGRFPSVNASAGVAEAASIHGNYVSSVAIRNGVVDVAYSASSPQHANPAIDGKDLMFAPQLEDGVVKKWTCDSGAGTTIDPKYLPTVCR